MERLVTVEFGPSRSKRFGKAVALAQGGPGECSESEPGRYRVTFLLGDDGALYGAPHASVPLGSPSIPQALTSLVRKRPGRRETPARTSLAAPLTCSCGAPQSDDSG